jgi:hypothetical protein
VINNKKKKWKTFIQIRTNKRKWTIVEFIGTTKSGRLIVKMESGEIVKRKNSHVRWGVPRFVIPRRLESDFYAKKELSIKKENSQSASQEDED